MLQASDHAQTHLAVTFGHGIEAVLRRQAVAHLRSTQTDATDAPRPEGLLQGDLGVDRLVRPMKRPDTEMDDAAAQVLPSIGRQPHRREALAGRIAQSVHGSHTRVDGQANGDLGGWVNPIVGAASERCVARQPAAATLPAMPARMP